MGVAQVRTKKRASQGGRKRKPKSPIDRALGTELDWQRTSPVFTAARDHGLRSFVYVIGEENDGPVKIGKAADPIDRLRTMQTGNSRRLKVEALLIGDRLVERLLHEIWEPHAIRSVRKRGKVDAPPGTEWFKAEIRSDLFPALETAATDQIAALGTPDAVESFEDLASIVLAAHRKHHDLVVHHRDEVRLLAEGAGTVVQRGSVILHLDRRKEELGWRRE
ncbi:MAG TPA: GIY-YIG nuclease family protein [Solirubrobacterales bacterium]|nr:GIY-YIG nuclease family protein [Solirubrobacterales bacterium]